MLRDVSGPVVAPVRPAAIPEWRSDLDPHALPPTPHLTLGQRRVLLACLEQFSAKGYVASSTRDIAAAMGIQSPSLYNHFASKEAMLSALVLLGYEHHGQRVMAALVGAPSTPEAQLAAVVREHILVSCEFARLSLVSQQELTHLAPETLARVIGYRSQLGLMVEQILRRGDDSGQFRVVHPSTTIVTVAGMGQVAAHEFPYLAEVAMPDYASQFVDLALRLVGAA